MGGGGGVEGGAAGCLSRVQGGPDAALDEAVQPGGVGWRVRGPVWAGHMGRGPFGTVVDMSVDGAPRRCLAWGCSVITAPTVKAPTCSSFWISGQGLRPPATHHISPQHPTELPSL